MLEPAADAVMVKSMVTDSPGYYTLLFGLIIRVCLAIYTGLHDVGFADGTVFYFDVPGPKGHGRPLFDFESLGY